MKIQQIGLFVAVCENKSIARAAHELYISQQAASKSVRELEEEFKCELLNRSSSGVTPTDYGEYVCSEFRRVLKIIDGIPSHLVELKRSFRETIRVGVAYGVIDSIGITPINHFAEMYPNVCLDISDDPDLVVEEELAQGKLDIAFVIEPVDRSCFDSYPLKTEPMVLCIHKNHPLFPIKNITVETLRGQKFANINPQFKGRQNLVDFCRKAGFEPEFVHNTNLVFATKEFCLGEKMSCDDQALNIVPQHKKQDNAPDIRYVTFQDPPMVWRISLATRKGQAETQGIRVFREYLLSLSL